LPLDENRVNRGFRSYAETKPPVGKVEKKERTDQKEEKVERAKIEKKGEERKPITLYYYANLISSTRERTRTALKDKKKEGPWSERGAREEKEYERAITCFSFDDTMQKNAPFIKKA